MSTTDIGNPRKWMKGGFFCSRTGEYRAWPSAMYDKTCPSAPVDYLSKLPCDIIKVVITFFAEENPCEAKLVCLLNSYFAGICRNDDLWRELCERQDWHRLDRRTGWHAMANFTWRKQFFKWCELRFEPSDSWLPPPKLKKARIELGKVTDGTGVWANLEAHLLAPGTATPTRREVYEQKAFKTARKYGPIESWDVSRVTNMNRLFQYASVFAGDISLWNVSNVKNMECMFEGCVVFNSNIGNWNVSNVQSMRSMFSRAHSFNQDIGGWDVSSVKTTRDMFYGNNHQIRPKFNQDISNWDVSNVEDMHGMFFGATAFTKDLTRWGEKGLQQNLQVSNMFFGSGVRGNEPGWYRAREV